MQTKIAPKDRLLGELRVMKMLPAQPRRLRECALAHSFYFIGNFSYRRNSI